MIWLSLSHTHTHSHTFLHSCFPRSLNPLALIFLGYFHHLISAFLAFLNTYNSCLFSSITSLIFSNTPSLLLLLPQPWRRCFRCSTRARQASWSAASSSTSSTHWVRPLMRTSSRLGLQKMTLAVSKNCLLYYPHLSSVFWKALVSHHD